MNAISPWLLIGTSLLGLIGLGATGLLVSEAQARQNRAARRVAATVAPFRRTRAVETSVFRAQRGREESLAEMVCSLFGFSWELRDQSPCKWWLVLVCSLVVARLAAGFVEDVLGAVGLVAIPAVWVLLCRIFFGWVAGRRREALLGQFPDALAMIVRSVRVGIPVLGAVKAVAAEAQAPTSIEFCKFADELAVGVSIDHAVCNLAFRAGLPEYRFFATAIGLQSQTGGGLGETLDNLADLIRKRLALRERGHALSSEARTSALILGALPVVMGLGLTLLNPSYMALLYGTTTGHKILGLAVGMLCMGAVAMQTIIHKSLS